MCPIGDLKSIYLATDRKLAVCILFFITAEPGFTRLPFTVLPDLPGVLLFSHINAFTLVIETTLIYRVTQFTMPFLKEA